MQETAPSRKTDWVSIMQSVFSILGSFVLWGLAFITVFIALFNRIGNNLEASQYDSFLMLAAGLFFCGILLIPSAVYSIKNFFNPSIPAFQIFWNEKNTGLVILLMPIILIIGNWLSNQSGLEWLILPIFHVLALSLPILWIIYIGIRELPPSSKQRRWGLFSFGLTLTPAMIMVIELFLLLVLMIIAVIVISTDTHLLDEMYRFSQDFNHGIVNPDDVYNKILPFFSHPAVFIFTIAFTSVLVPLIEEAIKPLGVWFLINRNISPAEGFIAGMLCGAGYGLLENFVLTYSSQDWVVTVTGRMGTSLIHIATSGLTGWALASAWKYKKYFQLGLAYLLSVVIHGIWNGLAISYGFASLLNKDAPFMVERMGIVAPLGLGVLTIMSFFMIILFNSRLRQKTDESPSEESNPL